jgi:hypothetical protein
MNKQIERFLNAGIPYSELDIEMIDLIDVLNFHLGLKTKYCCFGHDDKTTPYVVFDGNVTDEQIYRLAEQTGKSYLQINFNKWVRYYPVTTNWTMNLKVLFLDPNCDDKKKYLNDVVECLKQCKLN